MYIHYAFVQQAYNDCIFKWRRNVSLSEVITNTFLLASVRVLLDWWRNAWEEFHLVQAIKASYIHV